MYDFLLPVISMATDVQSGDAHVYLLEDGLELWLATLNHAPNPTPQLLQLFGYALWARIGKKHRINNHLIIHFPTSEGVSEVSKRSNESAVRGDEQTDKQVAQYCSQYFWL